MLKHTRNAAVKLKLEELFPYIREVFTFEENLCTVRSLVTKDCETRGLTNKEIIAMLFQVARTPTLFISVPANFF